MKAQDAARDPPVDDLPPAFRDGVGMAANVGRLRELLAQGWDVVDIVSDAWDIEVALRRGDEEIVLRLDRVDASVLLYGPPVAPLA